MQNATDHATRGAEQGAEQGAEATLSELLEHPAMCAADKIRAAVAVLRAVQEMRYNGEHRPLREDMRQSAIAALESAEVDAERAWQDACSRAT